MEKPPFDKYQVSKNRAFATAICVKLSTVAMENRPFMDDAPTF